MKQEKQIRKVLLAVILIAGITGNCNVSFNYAFAAQQSSQAVKKKNISVEAFAAKLEKAAGLKGGTLIKGGEFADTTEMVTWKQAALLLNRADELKNGTDYDTDLYKEVVDGKRLTGLKGLSEEEKKAARLCFVKGIISGSSKGNYSQSRAFRALDEITMSEANTVASRLKNLEKRVKLSPDGQVIRTTNLPKNYKKFDYILASFPNEFYERSFAYQLKTYYYEPVNLEDYACPKDMEKLVYKDGSMFSQKYELYGDIWLETIRTNLETRFNFDYCTVDNQWISQLAGTYIYDDNSDWNKQVTDYIKNYVEMAKKNHVIVKADKIVIEPSTFYYSGGEYYVRCFIKFKVNADTIYAATYGEPNKQHELIFSGVPLVFLENLKKNQWYEMSIDVTVRQTLGNQNPATYSIGTDYIWPWS